jgi:hypothetical protein
MTGTRQLAAALLILLFLTSSHSLDVGSQERAVSSVEFQGLYEGVRYTAEHAYGYTFELWRVDGTLFGLWSRVEGPPDRFLISQAYDVRLDSEGRMSFWAKFCQLKESFDGRLTAKSLSGTVKLESPKGVFDSKTVSLIHSEKSTEQSLPASEWKARIDQRLQRGTPDCEPLQVGK